MVGVLFVCGKARVRSPTAAELASAIPGVGADFGGVSADADERVSVEQVLWADVIAVMDRRQMTCIKRDFAEHLGSKRIVRLGVPDRYQYMQPELIERLTPLLNRVTRRIG
jgi:predicted protein tyrosine phosphatase